MGQRIIQKIYVCDICGEEAKDGDKLWEMGTEIWCEKCINESENEEKETSRE